MNHALDSIKGFIRLSGNASNKSMNNDIYDFSVLIFFFYISMWLGKVLQPFLVVWNFPLADWIKVNMDGADRGSPGLASCAEIFRGSMGEYVRGGFLPFLVFSLLWWWSSWDLLSLLRRRKKAGYRHLWMECDSFLVFLTINSFFS